MEKVEAAVGLFDWLKSINHHKQDLMDNDIAEQKYDAFMIRRGLAMDRSTVLVASMMNELHHVDNYMQYQYLLAAVPKANRFTAWAKKAPVSEEVKLVSEAFNVNTIVALSYLKLMNPAQLEDLKEYVSGGGKRKSK